MYDFLSNPEYDQVCDLCLVTRQQSSVGRWLACLCHAAACLCHDSCFRILSGLATVHPRTASWDADDALLTCKQAVQDAVIAAGVPQRLRTSRGDQQQQPCPNSIAGQHPRATAGTLSSAQSTISLSTPADQPQQKVGPGTTAAAAAKGVSASSAGARQQDPMVSEVRPIAVLGDVAGSTKLSMRMTTSSCSVAWQPQPVEPHRLITGMGRLCRPDRNSAAAVHDGYGGLTPLAACLPALSCS